MTENKAAILIIDDEPEVTESLARSLARQGYHMVTAASGEEGIEKVKGEKIDLVLLDLKLPGMDGLQALENIKKIDPEIEAIIITGHGAMDSAIESMRRGAYDYIEKPLSVEKVIFSIEKALDSHKLKETVALYEISKAVFTTIEMDALLNTIIDVTAKILRVEGISLMLFDDKKKLYIAVSRGISLEIKEKTKLAVGERIAGWVAEHKEPLILVNGLKGDSRFGDIELREEIRSSIIVPLKKADEVMGVLCANRIHTLENFTKSDLYKANIFVPLVCLALDNANLYKKLQSSQQQLVQSAKMASLGKLVADMAHEVNNPLMVISGRAQLSLMEKIENTALRDNLNIIVDQCKQARDIIHRLLTFSKPSRGLLEKADVNELLEFAIKLLEHQYSLKDIRFIRNFADSLPSVEIDKKQMQEVFMNIIKNAAEAMPGGGTIAVSTSKKSHYLALEIADTGEGISDEVLENIFIPFFTTKKDGTGLGLSVCYGIIKGYGGELKYVSKLGKGTTATILLPISQ